MTPAEIRAARLAIPLTPAELGQRVGVNAQSIHNWEAGRRTPRPDRMRSLEAVLLTRAVCTCACHQKKSPRASIPHWTREESALLRRLVLDGATPDEAVSALEAETGYRRTKTAVVHRAGMLDCSFYRDQYSGSDVARMLRVTKWRVTTWIERGWLRAERHVGVISGRTSRWWRVERSDLEAFVGRYAGREFDPIGIRDRGLKARAEVAAAVNRRAAV